jgi:heat shock protein 4
LLFQEDVASIEVVGDSHRIPAIADKLAVFFGKAPSKRTNATEVVAKGAAWQCARRSPLFKVGLLVLNLFARTLLFYLCVVLKCAFLVFFWRFCFMCECCVSKVMPYELKDLQSYPINFSWKWGSAGGSEGDSTESLVFPPHSAVPLFKQVTFKKQIDEGTTFSAAASYAEGGTPLPPGTAPQIGRWVIGSIPVDVPAQIAGEKSALKIGCKLDESGIVLVSRAEKEWNEEIEYEEEQEVPLTAEELAAIPAEAVPAPVAGDAAANGGEPPVVAAVPAPAAEAKQPKTKKIKVTKKRVVARSSKLEVVAHTSSLSSEKVRRFQEQEREMRGHDRLVVETAAEKNKVEAYVYETREKLSDGWARFATQEEKDKLSAALDAAESWLYEQGAGQSKAVYAARLADMRVLGDPIELRAHEAQERGPSAEELRHSAQQWIAWADGHEVAYDHISAEEKAGVRAKATAALEWLKDAMEKQDLLKSTEKPSVLSADIVARRFNLDKECSLIKSRPKPKPKAPEPAKQPAPGPTRPTEEAKPEDKQTQEEKQSEGTDKPEPMDTSV